MYESRCLSMEVSVEVKNEKVVRKVLDILDGLGIDYLFWGGLAYALYTHKSTRLKDVDILVSLNDMKKVITSLYENDIEFKYIPDWKSIVIEHNDQIIDLDPREWYSKSNEYREFHLFGRKVKVVTPEELARMYQVAINRNSRKKRKYLGRYKALIEMIKGNTRHKTQ